MATLRLEPVFTASSFRSPTNLVQADNGQVWVSEQAGRVWVFGGTNRGHVAVPKLLDITDRVNSRRSEEGLLGMALDPKIQRHLYVYYTPRPTHAVRWSRVSPFRPTIALPTQTAKW